MEDNPMRKQFFAPSLVLLGALAVLLPSSGMAAFAPSATGDQSPPGPVGGAPPGAGQGTVQSGQIAKSTMTTANKTNEVAQNTTSAAPTEIVAGHAQDARKSVTEAHKDNLDRAKENRDAREQARHDHEMPMDNGEFIATARTNEGSTRNTALAGKTATTVREQLAINGVNRDPQNRSNHEYRLKQMFEGPACDGLNTCNLKSGSLAPLEDKVALAFARYCDGLDMCHLVGGGPEKIAALRARAGLPMYAALTGNGAITATPIAAGGGGSEATGGSIYMDKISKGDNTQIKSGDPKWEAVNGGIFVRSPLGPDVATGAAANTSEGRIRTLEAIKNQMIYAENAAYIDCVAGGTYANPQQGPGDKETRALLQKDGYNGDAGSQQAGLSKKEQKRARLALAKMGAASSDTEGAKAGERNTRAREAQKDVEGATDEYASASKGCSGGSSLARSSDPKDPMASLTIFDDPRVIAWFKDEKFIEKVVAFRTVLPEIYAAENEVVDNLMYAMFEQEYGKPYAQYAKNRQEGLKRLASLDKYFESYGINPVDYNPTVMAMPQLIDPANLNRQYAANLPGFVGKKLPEVRVAKDSRSLKEFLTAYGAGGNLPALAALENPMGTKKSVLVSAR
jgi:hypothetical protein